MGERRDFLAFARENAIHVDLRGTAPPGTSPLAPLDPLLDGKRIVYLGEANHFIHEKYAYRLLFLRHLVARGFRRIVEELAWTDGVWIDRHLAGGDASCLDHVVAYGYRGGRRTDRDDSGRGILAKLLDRQPEAELGFEGRRFDGALRALSRSLPDGERLRFTGFDVDYEPGAGYEIFEPWLEGRSGADAAAIRSRLARVPGETEIEEADRLERAVAEIDARRGALTDALGPAQWRALRRAVRTTGVSHRYAHLVHAADDYPALRPAMALREELMVEHVREALGRPDADAGCVLLSHDLHLARDDAGIALPGDLVGPGGGRRPSVGCATARARPNDVFVVWMLEAEGRDLSPLPGWSGRIDAPRGTLNRLLAKVGDAFALPVRTDDPRARLLRREVDWVAMNGARVRCVMPAQADVLFFVRTVTPLHGR